MKRILFGTITSLMLSLPVLANTSLTTPSTGESYEAEKMEETTSPDGTTTKRTFESEKMEEGSVKSKEEMQKQEEELRKDIDKEKEEMNKKDSELEY